jgi:hypothetical protein
VTIQRLDFIEHPLWRTYIFVSSDGEQQLARWLEQVPEPEGAVRFARLLAETPTSSSIEVELSRP